MSHTNYLTKNAPYEVFMEDLWDFYNDPPIRPKLGSFQSYPEAVVFAVFKMQSFADSLKDDPACFYIVPEPLGLHFDSHTYEKSIT